MDLANQTEGSLSGFEQQVSQHYARRDLEQAVLDALAATGKDLECLAPSDLSPVDEFHTAGRQATMDFAAQMAFPAGSRLLDIGCGIGGAARFFAEQGDCHVTGIDLTDDYIRTAEALARRVRLADRVTFQQASALALPFEPETFDGAYMMHVGMNIEDKAALFAGVRRVLKSGALFGIFDIMRTGEGDISFPVPWSTVAATSFVASPTDYRHALELAGFEIVSERNRRELAREFFLKAAARAAETGGPPPLGIHLLMQNDVRAKIANVSSGIENGVIAPVEMIARARE